MAFITLYKMSKTRQYIYVVLIVCFVAVISYLLSAYVGYKIIAFVLLVTVSLIAMFFDILPVLLSAMLSALIWDFFFIPPLFTFHIGNTEDTLMLLMYFIIALVNAVLTFKIRQIEKEARIKEEKSKTVKLYNTLLNSLSHELRTPISTIIGASDNLLSGNVKISEENKHKLLLQISAASIRLNTQVDNLLNMSRLESGYIQPKKDWCDVNELVYAAINRLEDNLKAHKVEVEFIENLPLFKLDFGLLEQALYNLLNNAVLYTPEGSIIRIKVSYTKEMKGYLSSTGKEDDYQINTVSVLSSLIIIVSDNGKGFPEGETEKVFDKFYRLQNSATGGTGLGLSIVRGFIEAHKGTVHLSNLPEGGAKFTISIPAETTYLNQLKNE
jgi:two-component system sensor histidine kinase KdpD